MGLSPLVVEGLMQVATNEKSRELALQLGATVWNRIFRKEEPSAPVEGRDDLAQLVARLATKDEVAAAFATLEAKIAGGLEAHAAQHRRLIVRAALAIAALQILCTAAILAV